MHMKKNWAALGLLLLCTAGCAPIVLLGAGGAAGAAGYKFSQGALLVIYEAPYMETWDATLLALGGMNLKVKKQQHDITRGKIEAQRSDETSVVISMKYRSPEETEVSIRVGVFGDKDTSMLIKEEIRKTLFGN